MTVANGTVTLTIIYEGLLLYGPADNDEKLTSSKIYISIYPKSVP